MRTSPHVHIIFTTFAYTNSSCAPRDNPKMYIEKFYILCSFMRTSPHALATTSAFAYTNSRCAPRDDPKMYIEKLYFLCSFMRTCPRHNQCICLHEKWSVRGISPFFGTKKSHVLDVHTEIKRRCVPFLSKSCQKITLVFFKTTKSHALDVHEGYRVAKTHRIPYVADHFPQKSH